MIIYDFFVDSTGGLGWDILFSFTENRCHSGMFLIIRETHNFFFVITESFFLASPSIMQRNGAKLFAVGTGASLVI